MLLSFQAAGSFRVMGLWVHNTYVKSGETMIYVDSTLHASNLLTAVIQNLICLLLICCQRVTVLHLDCFFNMSYLVSYLNSYSSFCMQHCTVFCSSIASCLRRYGVWVLWILRTIRIYPCSVFLFCRRNGHPCVSPPLYSAAPVHRRRVFVLGRHGASPARPH